MLIPARTQTGITRNAHAGAIKAFWNIAGDINPNKMKRNSFQSRFIKRRQTMADLLKTASKLILQLFDIVARRLRGWMKLLVRQQHRAGKVAHQSISAHFTRGVTG